MGNNYEINIVHLYPDLLNLYGDRGNIACMEKRLKWRGIDAKVHMCTNQDSSIDLKAADIIFVGGGSDREQEIVCSLLLEKKEELKAYAENGGVLVAVCGGYQLLGKYYKTANTKIEGLGILDIYTDAGDTRLISNVVLECEKFDQPIVGFENHAGRTYIGENHTPLGKVKFGNGNTGDSGYEGVIYAGILHRYASPHSCVKDFRSLLKNRNEGIGVRCVLQKRRKVRSQHCMSSVPAFRQMSEVVWRMATLP